MSHRDPFNLIRFVEAHQGIYETALAELRAWHKESHWMWFIFPQIDGLGSSSTTTHYAIKSLAEARAYLAHPHLGPRLIECAQILLALKGRSAEDILGAVDAMKLRSSMTLFAHIGPAGSPFALALDKYFAGKADEQTLRLLAGAESSAADP